MNNKILVFQSDFGLQEGTVSQMHGISMKVDPSLKILISRILFHNSTPGKHLIHSTRPVMPGRKGQCLSL